MGKGGKGGACIEEKYQNYLQFFYLVSELTEDWGET